MAGSTTFTVNDNAAGGGPAGADCADADFSTIQDAVDASSTGGTILVCAGQYPESVIVTKDVTISGAQAGVDARTRSGSGGESVITADEVDEGGVKLNESGITFDGFVVANAADPDIGAGVWMSPVEGNYLITNNVITDSTIGIAANNVGGSPSTISRNSLSDNNNPGSSQGTAIYGDSNVDDLTITQNEFSDQLNAGILFSGSGPTASNQNVTISDNEFDGSSGNPAENELRILLLYTEDSTISGNTFDDMANNAIQLADGNADIAVSDNTIRDSGFAGVRITDFGAAGENSGISVIGNTLTGGDTGINVASDGHSGAITASGNRIVDNTTGILMNDTDATVNAANNWWGCNEGAGNPGCDSVGGTDAGDVSTTSPLTLSIEVPPKIKKGKTKTLTATINGGPSCQFPDGTVVTFATERGILSSANALTSGCAATTSLTAKGKKGPVAVSATLDNETVTDTVEFQKKKKKS
ncbi:MAG: hypothetical protein QOI31_715 [Solirubrobacterales bacterium]|jgi:hypothetical protein|nr:hypothetical protein [Solirubrobacterales bacterium]